MEVQCCLCIRLPSNAPRGTPSDWNEYNCSYLIILPLGAILPSSWVFGHLPRDDEIPSSPHFGGLCLYGPPPSAWLSLAGRWVLDTQLTRLKAYMLILIILIVMRWKHRLVASKKISRTKENAFATNIAWWNLYCFPPANTRSSMLNKVPQWPFFHLHDCLHPQAFSTLSLHDFPSFQVSIALLEIAMVILHHVCVVSQVDSWGWRFPGLPPFLEFIVQFLCSFDSFFCMISKPVVGKLSGVVITLDFTKCLDECGFQIESLSGMIDWIF